MRRKHPHTTRADGVFRVIVLLVVFLAVVTVLPASCGDTSENPAAGSSSATLSTLRKIDDYPLYVLRFYGDYGFSQYLRQPNRGEAPPDMPQTDGAWGCTTFAALAPTGEYVLGRNFDWYNHMALLLYTDPPDGSASVSMVDLSYLGFVPGDTSQENLTRLLRAPHRPFDGMNEHGVAIGMMAVPHAEGGNDDSKTTIGSLTAIRLVLDYAKNVDDAVSLLSRYNIDFGGGPPVHYLVSDATPRSVVIEFLDNDMVVIPSAGPWQAATNFILTGYVFDDSPSDCWRYNAVHKALTEKGGVISSADAMELLEDCSQPITMWSIVYGGEEKTVSVAAGRHYSNVHRFTIEELRSLR
jgi:hypothetical protein